MTKADFIAAIAAKSTHSKVDTERFLDAFQTTVTEVLAAKDDVKLPGFGTFAPSERKARTGRNPQTGAVLEIPASTVATFKPGAALKTALKAK